MPQYRYNLITDQWVIIAGDRGRRPTDFQSTEEPKNSDFGETCPFCPGHETMTPPETFAIRPADTPPDSPGWSVRVVPNKYPALRSVDNQVETNLPLKQHPGAGSHEVIIESPHHNICMGHHDSDQAVIICQILRDRYRYHVAQFTRTCHSERSEESRARIEGLVTIFYNHGATSGASLSHPHFQLLTQSVIPPRLLYLLQHCRQYHQQHGRSVFDAVIEAELDAQERILTCTDDFIVFCPFASRSPFEIYLLPRFEQTHFGQLDDAVLKTFSETLQQTLRCMDEHLNNPDYNMVFHTAPLSCHSFALLKDKSERSEESHSNKEDYPGFRWFLHICPRIGVTGGFELATDVFINTIPPETAAQFYRE